MKAKIFISLIGLITFFSFSVHAEIPSGTFKSIYVCGEELNTDLLEGKNWETAIGYYSGNEKQIYLAAGWPGFPMPAKITEFSDQRLIVEGYDSSEYHRIIIGQDFTMAKIGSKKYPSKKAINHLYVGGADLKMNLFCIYYPNNDVFFLK